MIWRHQDITQGQPHSENKHRAWVLEREQNNLQKSQEWILLMWHSPSIKMLFPKNSTADINTVLIQQLLVHCLDNIICHTFFLPYTECFVDCWRTLGICPEACSNMQTQRHKIVSAFYLYIKQLSKSTMRNLHSIKFDGNCSLLLTWKWKRKHVLPKSYVPWRSWQQSKYRKAIKQAVN